MLDSVVLRPPRGATKKAISASTGSATSASRSFGLVRHPPEPVGCPLAAARKHVRPGEFVWTIVGDAEALEKEISNLNLGTVEVHELND